MNPYVVEVTCSVCGGTGMAHASDRGFIYTNEFKHSDPSICASELRHKSKNLDKLIAQVKKEKAKFAVAKKS